MRPMVLAVFALLSLSACNSREGATGGASSTGAEKPSASAPFAEPKSSKSAFQ